MILKENDYPWGDHWEINRTNLWQGKFPEENQLRDGHYGVAPVNALKAQNSYEMHDMIGNVWEWTSTMYFNMILFWILVYEAFQTILMDIRF